MANNINLGRKLRFGHYVPQAKYLHTKHCMEHREDDDRIYSTNNIIEEVESEDHFVKEYYTKYIIWREK